MKIHIRRAPSRQPRKDGDQKLIKGVLHERISSRVMFRDWDVDKGKFCYGLAYNCTGGRQNHEWVPVDDLIGTSPYKRRRYSEIDGVKP